MMKKRLIVSLAVLFAAVSTFSYCSDPAEAIGGFMKNKAKNTATKEAKDQATKDADQAQSQDKATDTKAQKPQSSEPLVFENTKYHYKITYPGNWELNAEDPKKSLVTIVDTWGKMGNISVNATWMSDNFPVDPAVKALIDQAEQRKKHGELEDYKVKNYSVPGKDGKPIDVVKGVFWVESDEDPTMKRMQWQAYGGGNYYNFTASTSVDKFPEYRETFENMIDSVEFDFADGSFR